MLNIFICEDDKSQRKHLENTISNMITIEELDAQLVIVSGNPNDLLDYVRNNEDTVGLFFLDVDLHHELNGIALASMIKEIDPNCKIVFITTHNELSYLTFKYKIEAMDYILKDNRDYNVDHRVLECIKLAIDRYGDDTNVNAKFFTYNQGDTVRRVKIEDILFFETSYSAHKILVVLTYGEIEFYGLIKEIEKRHHLFCRVNKSCIVNVSSVESIDRVNMLVNFHDGQKYPIAKRRLNVLLKVFEVSKTKYNNL